MNTSRPLPVIMPNVADQRWSCHSCGECCRTLVIHLTDEDRRRIDQQDWTQELGAAPYVRAGQEWALNKRDDGACVFLDENTRCKIHSKHGEQAKPLACRIFPFSVRPVPHGWQASLRFDCPSVISSKGKPISQHRAWLAELVKDLPHGPQGGDDVVHLQRGLRATAEEIDTVTRRFTRWLKSESLPMTDRLIAAARVTTTLADATLAKVRDRRFAELLDVLFDMVPAECAVAPACPEPRQQGMLRQLAFAHAEHVMLREMRAGLGSRIWKRWQQLRSAGRFLKGAGLVPPLPGFGGAATFDAVESVGPTADGSRDIENLLMRYLSARLEGRSVFGDGYYGWPVVSGLAALWLSVAVAGWLARYAAAADGRSTASFADAARALGVVDRAATRLPILGTMAERARIVYLLKEAGVPRLVWANRLLEHAS